jgi:hypothetical protein
MRLPHHHDDNKEFYSCDAGAQYEDMLITLLLHVALTVPPSFSPAVARIAVAEAADIRMPYGVTIDPADELVEPSRRGFTLSAVETARVP